MSANKIKFGNYIDGKWNTDVSKEFLEVFDKYTQAPLAKLPLAGETEIESAIVAAQKGFLEIKSWSAGKRSEYLQKLWLAIQSRSNEIAEIIIKEAGKSKTYAEMEVKRCLSTVETAVMQAKQFSGEMVPIDYGAGEGKIAFTKRIPIGPVLCITPFNFPLNLVLHKVAPALGVGCSVIVKPAPQAPLSAIFLANLIEEVGYPAGVANFLSCNIPMAEKMVRDDRIAMISFTGSEKVGWYLKTICGRKKIALELGGNAAVIIDKDADLKSAAKTVAMGAFLYSGQICISTQRIFAVEEIYKNFEELLIAEIKNLQVGNPEDAKTTVGPLIEKQHLERVASWVKEAKDNGAKVLIGGDIADIKRNIFNPTLLTHTNANMKVVSEEAFGPLAVIEKVKDFDDAIEKVNASKFGLQAGVFTNDVRNIKKAHDKLEVGGVIINNVPGFRVDSMPYGGVKMSGLGREGIRYTMEEMTEPRLLVY